MATPEPLCARFDNLPYLPLFFKSYIDYLEVELLQKKMESDSLYTASMELTFFRNFIFDCLLGPWYLYADSVLIYFTVAIIIVIIMNLIIGLVFFVKEIRLKVKFQILSTCDLHDVSREQYAWRMPA